MASDDIRTLWIDFNLEGTDLATVSKILLVCATYLDYSAEHWQISELIGEKIVFK